MVSPTFGDSFVGSSQDCSQPLSSPTLPARTDGAVQRVAQTNRRQRRVVEEPYPIKGADIMTSLAQISPKLPDAINSEIVKQHECDLAKMSAVAKEGPDASKANVIESCAMMLASVVRASNMRIEMPSLGEVATVNGHLLFVSPQVGMTVVGDVKSEKRNGKNQEVNNTLDEALRPQSENSDPPKLSIQGGRLSLVPSQEKEPVLLMPEGEGNMETCRRNGTVEILNFSESTQVFPQAVEVAKRSPELTRQSVSGQEAGQSVARGMNEAQGAKLNDELANASADVQKQQIEKTLESLQAEALKEIGNAPTSQVASRGVNNFCGFTGPVLSRRDWGLSAEQWAQLYELEKSGIGLGKRVVEEASRKLLAESLKKAKEAPPMDAVAELLHVEDCHGEKHYKKFSFGGHNAILLSGEDWQRLLLEGDVSVRKEDLSAMLDALEHSDILHEENRLLRRLIHEKLETITKKELEMARVLANGLNQEFPRRIHEAVQEILNRIEKELNETEPVLKDSERQGPIRPKIQKNSKFSAIRTAREALAILQKRKTRGLSKQMQKFLLALSVERRLHFERLLESIADRWKRIDDDILLEAIKDWEKLERLKRDQIIKDIG